MVDACGLVATGIAQVGGVHGIEQAETYLVNIALPAMVLVPVIRVIKGDLSGGDILIGMDIINRGDFAVTNYGGTTKFSFRVPSQGHIDFVPAINEAIQAEAQPLSRAERRRQAKKARGR